MRKSLAGYKNMILTGIAAICIGLIVGVIDTVFGKGLLWVSDIRQAHVAFLLPFLPAIGVVIVGCYERFGKGSARGMSLIFEAGHGLSDQIPWQMIPLVSISTWLTHLFGGSAGREGVAIQIGGTIAHMFGKKLQILDSTRVLLIAGMAAGFSGLFQTPVAAIFFALEVLTAGKLEYKALFPATLASFTASAISHYLGLEKFAVPLVDKIEFSWPLLPKILLIGVIFGVTGSLFAWLLHRAKSDLKKWVKNPKLRIFAGGTLISALSLLTLQGRYSGLGTNLISMSFSEGVLPYDFALKFALTILTLAAGFQGGEVTPLFAIGSTLGIALAPVLGMPFMFMAALGYVGVFASATNTLIGPIIIGCEVFGYAYLPYFFVICAIAYVFNGNLSIYALQRMIDADSMQQ